MYKILYSTRVLKELRDLNNSNYLRIREKILSLEDEPRPVGSLKLTNMEGYRVRIGEFRILYEIDDKLRTIKLLRIGNRKEVYKKK